ncbi:MAG: hypothetical protein ACRCSS_07505, partial [Shewanella sp.]
MMLKSEGELKAVKQNHLISFIRQTLLFGIRSVALFCVIGFKCVSLFKRGIGVLVNPNWIL